RPRKLSVSLPEPANLYRQHRLVQESDNLDSFTPINVRMVKIRLERGRDRLLYGINRARRDFQRSSLLLRLQDIGDNSFLEVEDRSENLRVHRSRSVFLASDQIGDNVPIIDNRLVPEIKILPKVKFPAFFGRRLEIEKDSLGSRLRQTGVDTVWQRIEHFLSSRIHERLKLLQEKLATCQFGKLLFFFNDRSVFLGDPAQGVKVSRMNRFAQYTCIQEPRPVYIGNFQAQRLHNTQ